MIALAIAVLTLTWSGVSSAEGEARLVIDEPVHDFGAVAQGTFVHHVFRFRNLGDGDLNVGEVREPCGCTAAVISKPTVAAGDEGAISVSLDTGSFQGRKTKTVSVSTNDRTRPVRELTLTGSVVPKVVADPPVLYLGRVRPGAGVTGEVRILSTSGGAIDIADATTENPALEVAVDRLPDVGKAGRRLLVRIPPQMLPGRFSETVRVTTTDPEPVHLDVPVLGSIEGDLLVEPSQVMFISAAGGRRGKRELRVLNSGSRPISISGIRVPDFPLDYAISTVHVGYEYRIILRPRHPEPAMKGRGSLHIYTTHPEESELVVPLYAMTGLRGEAQQ